MCLCFYLGVCVCVCLYLRFQYAYYGDGQPSASFGCEDGGERLLQLLHGGPVLGAQGGLGVVAALQHQTIATRASRHLTVMQAFCTHTHTHTRTHMGWRETERDG